MGICGSAPKKVADDPLEVNGDIYNSDTRCVLTILETGEADFKFKQAVSRNSIDYVIAQKDFSVESIANNLPVIKQGPRKYLGSSW